MLKTYTWPRYAYRPPPLPQPRAAVAVVGAGPVGLAVAIDLAQRGLAVVVLDDDNTVSIGSRGVCHAKRTLEIYDRLGIGDAVVARGVTWNVGRTFHRDREVFAFDLLAEGGHRRPGMVNLQQYHLEALLVERAQALPLVDLRWQHKVVAVAPDPGGATLEVDTADGSYALACDWLVVADGARSPVRRMLGLDIEGRIFQDRFLIADVVLDGEPFGGRSERRFWFDPPFHPGQSALMHRQPDGVWRLDFQLGADADAEVEKQPDRVAPRVRALLDSQGLAGVGFELEWVSVYTFQCRRMARLRHGRVLFAGDAAHQVSPFGARGANSGVQDADNLGWKLALVVRQLAPPALLDSYDFERGLAADDNLLNSTRSTDFMTPKSHAARVLRDAVLGLAGELPGANFARPLVNSGRLSVPTALDGSALNTPDADTFGGWMRPGMPLDDAPVRSAGAPGWLLAHTGGGFVLLLFGAPGAAQAAELRELARSPVDVGVVVVVPAGQTPPADWPGLEDVEGLVAQRCDAGPGTAVLLRPDQHVAARWRRLDAGAVLAALDRACGREIGREIGSAEGRSEAPADRRDLPRPARADDRNDRADRAEHHPLHDGDEALAGAAAAAAGGLDTRSRFAAAGRPQRHPYIAGDAFYDLLVQAHGGLSDAQSELMNARLVLLLANQAGDLRVLHDAVAAAREGLAPNTENPR